MSVTSFSVRHGTEVVVELHAGAAAPAVAAQVRRDNVIAGSGNRQHHLAPAVRELREPMHQQHRGAPRALVSRFEHVHADSVDVLEHPRADATRQHRRGQRTVLRRRRDGRLRLDV